MAIHLCSVSRLAFVAGSTGEPVDRVGSTVGIPAAGPQTQRETVLGPGCPHAATGSGTPGRRVQGVAGVVGCWPRAVVAHPHADRPDTRVPLTLRRSATVDSHGRAGLEPAWVSPRAGRWLAVVTGLGRRAAAVAVLALVAACEPSPTPPAAGRSEHASAPSSPSASASASASASGSRSGSGSAPASAEGQVEAVEVAYRRYWQVSRDLDQRYPRRAWRRVLAQVAADPALSLVLARTAAQTRNRTTLYGAVVPHPTVALHGPAAAGVRDCQDASRAGQADAVTGARRTVGVARNLVTAQLIRGGDGRWRVSSVSFPGGSC
jgi:hypothetical protein